MAVILVFGFSSCEDPISIDFPGAEKNLVLNSLLQNGDTIKAMISESLPYTDLSQPSSLNNGSLRLYKNGIWISNAKICERELLNDEFKDSTYTYCFDQIAEDNSQYKIVASTDQYNAIEGETSTNSRVELKNVVFNGTNTFSFEIDDNPNENNFYFFRIGYRYIELEENEELVFLNAQDLSIEMIGFSDDVISFPSSENVGTVGFINDKTFNGRKKTIILKTGFMPESGIINFILSSCSEEYFDYSRTSLRAQLSSNDLFSASPEIYSNVSNGYGLVGSTWDTLIPISN